MSCSDSPYEFTYNWVFETQHTVNTIPYTPEYSKIIYLISTQKGLTVSEADKIVSLKTNYSITKTFGYSVRVDNICHKYIESAYVLDTTRTNVFETH